MKGKVYNVPLSCSFVKTLAERFLKDYKDNPLGLCDVVFLMPNRRSCLSLKQAFLNANGLTPFLLPQILPVGDIDEDEIFFDVDEDLMQSLPAAISNEERLFLFAKMIASKHEAYGIKDISFAQSLALANDLGKLIDSVYNESLCFDNLENIVPEQYASHWQETLKFLKIVTQFWPEILKERGLIDGAHRRNILLSLEAEKWRRNPPHKRIVAAGLSVAFDGLKKILKTVFELENGEIFLYGLDRFLSTEDFEKTEPSHAQYEKKKILELLELKRDDVKDVVGPEDELRERLVSEMMRPAETTAKWRDLCFEEKEMSVFNHVHLIETQTQFEEAMSIALVMRETLETKHKTAALVTTDRNLAREVSGMLKCFGVDIDDSAGVPLHLSPIGIYLRQILEVLNEGFSQNSVAALVKNMYVRLGFEPQELRKKVRASEFDARKPIFEETPEIKKQSSEISDRLEGLFSKIRTLYGKEKAPFKELLKAHIETAEALAETDEQSGADLLWRHDDGRVCAGFLSRLLDKADVVGDIYPMEYSAVFNALLATETVRKSYGGHPRLKILGPIEARFNRFDVMIVGSLNEGVWPKAAAADPFMSRSMKKAFGLPLPERALGVLADDLSALMCSPEVFLTRAQRVGGVPMGPSRYLLRLETVLKACGFKDLNIRDLFYQKLVQKIILPNEKQKSEPPCPKPPLEARPRRFSVSSISKLMINPYDIYAKYILKLRALKDLDEKITRRDYGTIVHNVLKEFTQRYKGQPDEKEALECLLEMGEKEFEKYDLEAKQKAFFKAGFRNTAEWFVAIEEEQRKKVLQSACEISGEIKVDAPAGSVTLTARADRIDELKDGTYEIIDYKTGRCPSSTEVKSGYAPQLPLEALIAENSGKKVSRLSYWRLGDKVIGIEEKDIESLLVQTKEQISEILRVFDDENTPYLASPNPKKKDDFSDYEHLARVKEWGSGDGND